MQKKQHLYAPRYWLSWVGLWIIQALAKLPYPVLVAFGRVLGKLAYFILPSKRHIGAVNIALAYPNKSPAERESLLKQNVQNTGIGAIEAVMATFGADFNPDRYEIRGRAHLEAAQARGKGVMLLTVHTTPLELGLRILGKNFPVEAMYRPLDNAVLNAAFERQGKKFLQGFIPHKRLNVLLDALKANKIVWYAPDQGRSSKYTQIVDFLGTPAVTNTSTAWIAQTTGCQIVPYWTFRDEVRKKYILEFLPALTDFPSDDVQHDARKINQIFETWVHLCPEQYLWLHKRYKNNGQPDVYRRGVK